MTKAIFIPTAIALILGATSPGQAVWASPAGESPTTLRALFGLKAPDHLERTKTALVLVDFQEEFLSGKLRLPGATRAAGHAAELLDWARRNGILVVHVRNIAARASSPVFAPDSPGSKIIGPLAPAPGELVITKSMVGAVSRTALDQQLRERQIETLVVAGFMTHLAVQATAIDATVLGYRVVVAADAVATRALPGAGGYAGVDAELLQRAVLAGMADRVADVMLVRQITRLSVQ